MHALVCSAVYVLAISTWPLFPGPSSRFLGPGSPGLCCVCRAREGNKQKTKKEATRTHTHKKEVEEVFGYALYVNNRLGSQESGKWAGSLLASQRSSVSHSPASYRCTGGLRRADGERGLGPSTTGVFSVWSAGIFRASTRLDSNRPDLPLAPLSGAQTRRGSRQARLGKRS